MLLKFAILFAKCPPMSFLHFIFIFSLSFTKTHFHVSREFNITRPAIQYRCINILICCSVYRKNSLMIMIVYISNEMCVLLLSELCVFYIVHIENANKKPNLPFWIDKTVWLAVLCCNALWFCCVILDLHFLLLFFFFGLSEL